MLKLYIGNKNYSSWSMRAWVLLRQAGIAFEEVKLRFDSFDVGSDFKRAALAVAPTGKVPVLVDGDLVIWDSLAIAEYVAEKFPEKQLWPVDSRARARARSVCADVHSDFTALRTHCTMNIEAKLPDVGVRLWRKAALRAEVDRLVHSWRALLAEYGGPLLFGNFTIADAYFAPICMRLVTYELPLPEDVAPYVAHVRALPGVAAWIADALVERDFLPFEEPYRTAP